MSGTRMLVIKSLYGRDGSFTYVLGSAQPWLQRCERYGSRTRLLALTGAITLTALEQKHVEDVAKALGSTTTIDCYQGMIVVRTLRDLSDEDILAVCKQVSGHFASPIINLKYGYNSEVVQLLSRFMSYQSAVKFLAQIGR